MPQGVTTITNGGHYCLMVCHLFPRRLQTEVYTTESVFVSFREMLTTTCATDLHSGVLNLVAFLEEAFSGATKDRLINIFEDKIFTIS